MAPAEALVVDVTVRKKLDAETGLLHLMLLLDGKEAEAYCGLKARDFRTQEQTHGKIRPARLCPGCARCIHAAR